MAQPEHVLQVQIHKWVDQNIPKPYFFCAFDRSRKQSALQHVREKARGLVAGTPDCELVFPGLPAMWVELKVSGNRPSAAQTFVGASIQTAGHHWGWCTSVIGYAEMLKRWGVPVPPSALLDAMNKDALIASKAIRREESKTGRPSKKRRSNNPRGMRRASDGVPEDIDMERLV